MIPFEWRDLPPLPALRAFEAAARLGSFSAAARVLNVTHPAVAQQVRGLEKYLGLRLIADAGRSLRLTEDGQRLSATLNAGFAGMAETLATLRNADQRRGLRVALTPGLAQQVVMPALPDFWAAHPDIAVSLVPETRVADLSREKFDLAIRSGGGGWTDGTVEFLCKTRVVLVGAPQVLDRSSDLHALPWILNFTDPMEPQWLAAHGIDRNRIQAIDIDNPMLAYTAALHGGGLLFATEAIVRRFLGTGQLREVPGWTLPESAYWVVIPHGPARAAVTVFIDWLRKRL